MNKNTNDIFTGIRVLDLTKVFSAPFATRLLADYGAEVIKIENILHPDDSRSFPPLKNGWSGYFEILNRNKKCLDMNLKDKTGLADFYNLCKSADVIVENLSPPSKYKLKINYEIIKKLNPKIIYASLSGKGQDSDEKYYDIIAQAESGMMSLTGTQDMPIKVGPAIIDAFSGVTLAFGIASALFYRQKSGKGQYLDVSMLSCSMNLLEHNLIGYSLHKKNPVRLGNRDNAIAPFGVYKTKDAFMAIAAGNNKIWHLLENFLSQKKSFDTRDFKTNETRLKNQNKLTKIIEEVFAQFGGKALQKKLSERGIPCSLIHEISDVYSNNHLYKSGALKRIHHPRLGKCVVPGQSINFSASGKFKTDYAPEIGQHNKLFGI